MKATTAIQLSDRLPRWAKNVLAAASLLVLLAALAVLPIPLAPYLDFQVLYQTNMGLLRGISPYDHVGQVNLIAQLAHVTPSQVYSLPFPYPPWYALGTVWLAWLSIEAAVRVWFGINLILLLASVWLLTDGWRPLKRLLALALAIFFLPVLGSLAVGQYGFPVLLGAALMTYTIRREKAFLTAAAAALLTLKPHLGGLIIVAALIYLMQRRDAFARRALEYCVAVGAALFCVGFLADSAWPVSYLRSLMAFRQDAGVTTCGLCASLPVLIAGLVPGGPSLSLALGIGVLILAALTIWWLLTARQTMREPLGLLASCILILLLANPYLLNYDFLLLLVPFALLAGEKRRPADWILLAGAYGFPFVALGALGRQGNFIFPICTLVLLVMLYGETRQLDTRLNGNQTMQP